MIELVVEHLVIPLVKEFAKEYVNKKSHSNIFRRKVSEAEKAFKEERREALSLRQLERISGKLTTGVN